MADSDFVEVQFTYCDEVSSECALVLRCNNWVPVPMAMEEGEEDLTDRDAFFREDSH